jgi:plastocyanin
MTRRLLIGLVAAVVLAGCGGGNTSNNVANNGGGSGTPATGSPNSNTVQFKETEYTISPDTLSLKPGTYTFTVQDVGQFPHDMHVATASDGTEVGGSTVLRAGQSTSFTVTLKTGQYTMWCAVDGHRSLGMQGTITVQ